MMVLTMINGDNGEEIIFQQKVIDDNDILVDNVDCIEHSVNLSNGISASLYEYNDGTYILVWKDDYAFIIQGGNVGFDILIDIANNII